MVLFGLVPSLHGTRTPLEETMRATGRSATGGRAASRLRQALVGSQFAIVTPLLVGAGLLLSTLAELKRVDPGFDTSNILTGSISLPPALYPDDAMANFWKDLRERVSAVPGVAAVAYADGRPPNDVSNFNNFDLEAHPAGPGESQPVTPWVAVTPEYFNLLGLELIEGRLLERRDAEKETIEDVVVDRAWAQRFFPTQSAIGKRFKEGGCTACPWTTVVGVVGNVKYAGLEQADNGSVYWPLGDMARTRNLIVRTTIDPSAAIPPVVRVMRELNPAVPLSSVQTIDELMDASLDQPRSLSVLIGVLAVVALTLSLVGIYGVMAHYVQQYAKDISIRLALGGRPSDVLRLVVGQGMNVVVIGVAAGMLAAFFLARLMSSLLFGVAPTDLATFAGVGGLLLLVGALACLIPARRATAIAPAAVLRTE
jgi:predicted permease